MTNNTKIAPAQLKAEITKRNKVYKKATPAQKRVLIAKDVIKQIKLRRFVATSGDFVGISSSFMATAKPKDNFQKLVLSNKLPSCHVCGIGSLILSCTLFANKVQVKDYDEQFHQMGTRVKNKHSFKNGFEKVFSWEQLIMIEQAFELGEGFFTVQKVDEYSSIKFGEQYEDPTRRLLAIMQNIITNKGTFIP